MLPDLNAVRPAVSGRSACNALVLMNRKLGRSERGGITVVTVIWLAVGLVVVLGVAAGAAQRVASARLEATADLVALAGAAGDSDRADVVARSNGVHLVRLSMVGESAVIFVSDGRREASASAHLRWVAVGNVTTGVDFPRARRYERSG